LGEKLIENLPSNQQSVFFNNGSTAVEVAIKVLQFFFNKGEKRTTIIAFENAFHGDTCSYGSKRNFFTQAFEGMFIDVVRIPAPVRKERKL
jgi:adenosylmethionine-8-amino-7-oxononanoate aminotransferase